MLALLDKRLKVVCASLWHSNDDLSQELTSVDVKRSLLANLDDLKQCIPKLTASMQACIRNPHDGNAKVWYYWVSHCVIFVCIAFQ